MEGFGQPTQRERLKMIAAILRRVYSAEPCQVPEFLKERMRRLKELNDDDADEHPPRRQQ